MSAWECKRLTQHASGVDVFVEPTIHEGSLMILVHVVDWHGHKLHVCGTAEVETWERRLQEDSSVTAARTLCTLIDEAYQRGDRLLGFETKPKDAAPDAEPETASQEIPF